MARTPPKAKTREARNKNRRAALVTGAAQRIGRAMALALGRNGWAVAVHYHTNERAALKLVAELKKMGAQACALHADLADTNAPFALVSEARRALGPLRLLVNNASVFEPDEFATLTTTQWSRTQAVNLQAPLFLAQAFSAQVPQRASANANIVNLLDQRVWNLAPDFLSYTIAKSALWSLTQCLAQALAPAIRVNGIGPGPTLPSARQSVAGFRRSQKRLPLQRGATPDELAQALLFILATPSLTGQMLALDGGQHLQTSAHAE